MNANVSWSHHCRLSIVSRTGRSTASSARLRPSKKRWRCQASTIARAPAGAGSARVAGGRQQALHLGPPHRVDRRQRRRGRPACAASPPPERARAARRCRSTGRRPPRRRPRRASSASSAINRDLPTPGSPRSRTSPGRPSAAARQRPRRARSSRARPTNRRPPPTSGRSTGSGVAATAGPDRGQQPVQRGAGERVGLDAQLALQDRRAVVVGAHRARAVALVALQLHQRAVAGLLQRAQLHAAAGGVDRSGQVAGRPVRRDHRSSRSTHCCSSSERASRAQSSSLPGRNSPP